MAEIAARSQPTRDPQRAHLIAGTIAVMKSDAGCNRYAISARPSLVVVGGAPAAGKTTLARMLATELRLPLLAKDTFKEAFGDALGAADPTESGRLGHAAHVALFTAADLLLDAGVGAVLESNFRRGLAERWFEPLLGRARLVTVQCVLEPDLVLRRYRERAGRGERHTVHFDGEAYARVQADLDAGLYEPLLLPAPVIRVRTEDDYDPPLATVLTFIREPITDM